jgi:hypothetical protein
LALLDLDNDTALFGVFMYMEHESN